MNPIYLDLHIHTSEDPNNLNENYDLDTLISKVRETAQGDDFLISFTDHNVINEKVYLEAIEKIGDSLILGVELHIQTHKGADTKAYHCHIYFDFDDIEITSNIIKDINSRLDTLYKNKTPNLNDKSIPFIQDVLEIFDEYNFILLPHGGQSNSTFNKAMPSEKEFDNTLERSIYYNFFDGFTSRSNKNTQEAIDYLKRLGVNEFINLVTCTDNYNPSIYPKPKDSNANEFIPTWMFATPTFGGLRLSLSDSSRLKYSNDKPKKYKESIKKVELENDQIKIDINLTPGLNVIIGGSSSGKTLLIDSLNRKLNKIGFENDNPYEKYGVKDIKVDYSDGSNPYYIGQNFVTSVTLRDKAINEIGIINKLFPDNSEARKKITRGINGLNEDLTSLFNIVENIETLEEDIKKIPILSRLINLEKVNENILKELLSVIVSLKNATYKSFEAEEDLKFLDKLNKKIIDNPFSNNKEKIINELKAEIIKMRDYSNLEDSARKIIKKEKEKIDKELKDKEGESQDKKIDFETLIDKMKKYYIYLLEFDKILDNISKKRIKETSDKIKIKEYVLSIENKFELNKDLIVKELNNLLLKGKGKDLENFSDINPRKLFKGNFRNNFKGTQKSSSVTYKSIIEKINNDLVDNDEVKYKIYTPEGEDFEDLSPGLKTATILELILSFEGDGAPLIIDQPEDNLATNYMNNGLVESIKNAKHKRQIILVSHNATIPMGGDAQNIILCKNNKGKIEIKSSFLEGKIGESSVLDHIAEITDGGKSSIKKRFKKYNLKKFK